MIADKTLYRKFSSPEEAAAWGNEHYKKWADEYKSKVFNLNEVFETPAKDIIECYCGYNYKQINSLLRGTDEGFFHWEQTKHKYETMSHILAVLIMYAPRIPENIVVYRGVPRNTIKDLLESARKSHGWVQDKGFLCTSLLHSVPSQDDYEAILRIDLPKGYPGIYASCVADRSEYEIILLPNSRVRLIDHKEKPEKTNGKRMYKCDIYYSCIFEDYL